ncbi:M14 family metallopeptidase [Qipengyuania sphaerica]|uniref:M14 family metallopeptidase n=1 Tax=Qipengyuania sphaerica TaxID=2867243 RepID=UPI001C8723D6|nr:M14 family metallopeptidase [Qipengyuania sphaerica]MBX7541028.1 carboxypeptidase [Qipengyuania sphaerica]
MLKSLRAAALLGLAAVAGPLAAQSVLQGNFDPSIPTLEQTVGHPTGAQVSAPHEITDYLEALHQAAPQQTRLVRYATSWEGRPLHYLVISSATNMARLDANKAAMASIAGGSTPPAGTLPVTWLSYGVHGNEISSSDAALALAYHLLAAQGDARTDNILANSYVIIDPSQNPDGRNRFVTNFRNALGLEPSADRFSAEHDEPWPAGRTNHYLFDLNRDWFALTQPETRGKVAALLEWNPVVFVDAHEMGGDETYYFPPAAEPFNPNITAEQKQKQVLLGRAIARDFDQLGIPYFTREIYDAFYPGYGDTWPTLQGAIGATFEQASARGLAWERTDGDVLTYAEGVRNHFLSSFAYAETVAQNADRFLADYAAYRRTAVQGRKGGTYLIDLSQRRWNAESLGRRLAEQGIAVRRIGNGFSACGKSYPQGALAIDRNQPTGRLIRSLLDRDTPLDADFVRRQEERRTDGQPHELYDTTAWSVGMMSGVDVAVCSSSVGQGTPLDALAPIEPRSAEFGDFGMAIPWTDTGQAQLVLAALREGIEARASEKDFAAGGRSFPRGTVIIPRRNNDEDALARISALARNIGAETVPLADSWVESGPNYGSDNFARLAAPRIAMAWDRGITPTSAGSLRYVIERRLATPVVPIRTAALPRADLSEYDVLLVPEGTLDLPARKAVLAFVKNGGVAVIVGEALTGFTKEETRLFATSRQGALGKTIEGAGDEDDDEDKTPLSEGTEIEDADAYEELIDDPNALPDTLPGALVNTVADRSHFLSSGYDKGPVVSASGDLVFTPLNKQDGVNVLRFAPAADLVASGYVWDENRRQMAFKPYLMAERTGRGIAIGFAHDPSERGYLDGLDLLIANAILLAPAHTK